MEEILFELQKHAVALNSGRWDYIFSHIKHQSEDPKLGSLPDRSELSMECNFLAAYSKELVRVCHKRGALAIGGMAAQIPNKKDAVANERAMAKVRADKQREFLEGYDGTWVAHPALVPIALEAFGGPIKPRVARATHEVNARRSTAERLESESALGKALLGLPDARGGITLRNVEDNVAVCLTYLDKWLDGEGCVALNGLMEDAATAEISRAQLWAWMRHGGHIEGKSLTGGVPIDLELIRRCVSKCEPNLKHTKATVGVFMKSMTQSKTLRPFLTADAYPHIVGVRRFLLLGPTRRLSETHLRPRGSRDTHFTTRLANPAVVSRRST